MPLFEFSSRKSLWTSQRSSKYLPQRQFGNVISSARFDDLRKNLTISFRANSSDRWGIIRDFIVAINEHRDYNLIPSRNICIDGIMSRCNGLQGDSTEIGLLHLVCNGSEPENGFELKIAACRNSIIKMRIENIVLAEDTAVKDCESDHLEGTAVTLILLER